MSMNEKEKSRALFRGKVEKYCKENNLILSEFLQEAGIIQTKYRRIYKGGDVFFSTIIRLVQYTKGYFNYEELAAIAEFEPENDRK